MASKDVRLNASDIHTAQGTIHVRPYRVSGSKNLSALVSFTPRHSYFDLGNQRSGSDAFRGFYSLFWIAMFLLMLRSYVTSFEQTGYPLSLAFATLFSKDAKTLAISDAIMVFSTVLCVPFIQSIQHGWIPYYWTGLILQHFWQAVTLALAITWTFNREWPWVQSGFFTLHAIVMLMKIHSYLTVNGHLSALTALLAQREEELKTLCETPAVGGYTKALADAKSGLEREIKEKEKESGYASGGEQSTGGTATPIEDPALSGTRNAAGLRERVTNVSITSASGVAPPSATITGTSASSDAASHPLLSHPREEVRALATIISDIESELTSRGPARVRWPENVTYANYFDYLLVPSLVYELEYPRTDRIRPLYVFEKTVATFGTFTLLYSIVQIYILPLTPTRDQSFARSLLDLALPFMLCYILLFYIIFECVCNGFAELSRFADREFYEDWWNSTTWDEYARKWNKPVHAFLLRHVYASTMASSAKFSKSRAAFVTFLLSACAHELVMAIVTKKIRMYLFLMQMIQIPLIALGRVPWVRRNKMLGNVIFWMGLMTGLPLLCVAYCAY